MHIGVPHERRDENRVGLTPMGASFLVGEGHTVYVERGAGEGAGFSDEDYQTVGAQVVYSAEEAWGRADLVLKVAAPHTGELGYLREGQIICGFLHRAVAPRRVVDALLERRITALAYELIQEDDGTLPILMTMSTIAGRMAPQIAGELLTNTAGGRGVLLGGAPGIPPAEVVIVGGGVVGYNAARAFLGLGAQVTILDIDPRRLRELEEKLGGRAATMFSTPMNLRKVCKFADVLVTAILIPGARAPIIITRDMVRSMKPRSVIIDFSIDQGGCVETSRLTTHQNPTFVEENVIHYCVPNISSKVARTASHALTNAHLPYMLRVAHEGFAHTVATAPALARGVVTHQGHLINPAVAASFNLPVASLEQLLDSAPSG